MNDSIVRIFSNDLVGLDSNGRPCEACGKHMHIHEWADVDINGFVVSCSEEGKA